MGELINWLLFVTDHKKLDQINPQIIISKQVGVLLDFQWNT